MSIHCFTSEGRNHVNQDIAGSAGSAFWVLDGATPLFGDDLLQGNDVQTAVGMISEFLEANYDHCTSPAENLRHACLFVQQYYRNAADQYDSIEKYKLPTFAAAMVQIHGCQLQYFVIGDCEIRYGDRGLIRDESFSHVKEQNDLDARQILSKYGAVDLIDLSDAQRKAVHDEIVAKDRWQRSRLNSDMEKGYWIGSLDASGISHGKSGSTVISMKDKVFVYCDGMAHLIEKEPDILEREDIPSEVLKIRDVTDDDVTIAWYIRDRSRF